jgi:hypothetical protein
MYEQTKKSSNSLATASLTCSIFGILMTFFGAGFFFGALAIILGLLSRGDRKKATGTARRGIMIGVVALITSIIILAGSYAMIVMQYGSFQNYYDSYMYTIEQTMGDYL